MRRFAFLLLLLLLSASPAAAQGIDPLLPAEGTVLRPAEVVAQMARQAMGLPADPEGWRALADALPGMALLGGADLEGTFEAARIADSLSTAALAGPVETAEADWATAFVTLLLDRWKDLTLAFLVTTALVVGLISMWRRQTQVTPPIKGGRVIAAKSLVDRGVPAYEIARRTGMAQDAVHVLFSMSLSGKAPLPPKASSVNSTRPVAPPTTATADLEREALLAARRLRDRRLTYGPGARA